jgi:hypothetical protein
MEGLKGVELLMVYAVGFAVFLAAIGVWILAFRWMWKQRGIGFAQGWYEVVDRRALIEDAMSHRVTANSNPPVGTGHATAARAPTAEKKSDQTRDAGHLWLGGGR